jgi:hypothetical protein
MLRESALAMTDIQPLIALKSCPKLGGVVSARHR